MSDALTDLFETSTLQYLFTTGTPSPARPTSWYVGLFASGNAPTDSTSGTEISGNNYARVSATFSVSGNQATNTATLTFPTASGSWGSVTTAGIFDASTSGNLIAYASLSNAKTIQNTDILQIASGTLTVTLT